MRGHPIYSLSNLVKALFEWRILCFRPPPKSIVRTPGFHKSAPVDAGRTIAATILLNLGSNARRRYGVEIPVRSLGHKGTKKALDLWDSWPSQ